MLKKAFTPKNAVPGSFDLLASFVPSDISIRHEIQGSKIRVFKTFTCSFHFPVYFLFNWIALEQIKGWMHPWIFVTSVYVDFSHITHTYRTSSAWSKSMFSATVTIFSFLNVLFSLKLSNTERKQWTLPYI